MEKETFILASASPRRRQLLDGVGAKFEIIVSDAEENIEAGLTPAEQVCRLSQLKAASVAAAHADRVVVAADTHVAI